jgi:hypothetical protein
MLAAASRGRGSAGPSEGLMHAVAVVRRQRVRAGLVVALEPGHPRPVDGEMA